MGFTSVKPLTTQDYWLEMETRASKRTKQNLEEDNGRKDGKRDGMSNRIRVQGLNDFPEDILKHILTFLPTVDAVRTTFLSREWRIQKLWRPLPSMDFIIPSNRMGNWTLIAEFIDQTLKNRSGFPIQKFRFHLASFFCFLREHDICDLESKLDEWISYAISHKATELDIMLPYTSLYEFNFGLLNDSCVRDVRFSAGTFSHGLPYLNLDSIRSVCLVNIILTDDNVVDLISGSNNLESLTMEFCSDMKRLRICSTTLKKLSLVEIELSSLKICCPNLCSLLIWNVEMKKFCIKGSSSLDAEVNLFVMYHRKLKDGLNWWSKVLRVLTCVKRLTTQNYWFELLCKNDASLDGFVFENLNHLELMTGYGHCDLVGMAALLKICPNITTLTLSFFPSLTEYDGLVPKKLVDKHIEFNIPNLKILNLKNTKVTEIEELLRLMNKHGAALEKIVVWERDGKRSSIPLQGSGLNV